MHTQGVKMPAGMCERENTTREVTRKMKERDKYSEIARRRRKHLFAGTSLYRQSERTEESKMKRENLYRHFRMVSPVNYHTFSSG